MNLVAKYPERVQGLAARWAAWNEQQIDPLWCEDRVKVKMEERAAKKKSAE